jgi:hypothetical protein
LGHGVEDAVVVVLNGDLSQHLGGGAVAVHMGPGDHSVEPREGRAVVALVLGVGGGPQRIRRVGTAHVRHLLNAAGEDYIAVAARDLERRHLDGRAAGSTGGLDARRRQVPLAQVIRQ